MKSPTTNNERVRTPRKNKKQKGSVYQRTSKKERSSRKRKNSRKERRKQKRTKRKNKNRIYIKRRIEGGGSGGAKDGDEPAALVLELEFATQKHVIKEKLLKIKLPEALNKMSGGERKNNLENFTPLWRDLDVHMYTDSGTSRYYYKIRSCNNSQGLIEYLRHCLKNIDDLTEGNTDWGKKKIDLFNGDLKKIQGNKDILGKIPEEFIIQLFKHIRCSSKDPDDGTEDDSEEIILIKSEEGSFAPYEMVSFDNNDLESLSNFQEDGDTVGPEPTPWVALQERLLDAQDKYTLLGYIPTLGCLPKDDAYMLKYTVEQKVNKILELLDDLTTMNQGPKFSPDVRRALEEIRTMLDDFIKGGSVELDYRVDNVDRIKPFVQKLKALVQKLKDSGVPDENEKIEKIDNINIILEELKRPGTCRWQNEDGINEFIKFLNRQTSPWLPGDKEIQVLNEIKGIIRASRKKYKKAVLDWGGGNAHENDEVMARIYKRGYIEEHLLALMNKYPEDGNKGGTNVIFKGGIYQSTRSTISSTSEDSGDSYAARVPIIEELIKNEKARVKKILSNSSIYYSTSDYSTSDYSTSDSGSIDFETPRNIE
tara:strand:- start:2803 stop:4587 length:1785 start_codon:yes stop_codon:yes gene_type:complete